MLKLDDSNLQIVDEKSMTHIRRVPLSTFVLPNFPAHLAQPPGSGIDWVGFRKVCTECGFPISWNRVRKKPRGHLYPPDLKKKDRPRCKFNGVGKQGRLFTPATDEELTERLRLAKNLRQCKRRRLVSDPITWTKKSRAKRMWPKRKQVI